MKWEKREMELHNSHLLTARNEALQHLHPLTDLLPSDLKTTRHR